MNKRIKKLLIPFFIMFLVLTQLHATEANKPNTEIVLVIAQDGGIVAPFDENDSAIDGNGLHTAGKDGANGAITAERNNVVRTYDMVRYDVHWNVNDVDSAQFSDGNVTNLTLKLDTNREDVRWVKIPEVCRNGSALSDNGNGADTFLTCNLGTKTEGTMGTMTAVAKVWLKADGTPSDNEVITLNATIKSDQNDVVTSNSVSTTISAKPAGNWKKGPADIYRNIDNGGTDGIVLVYPLSFLPSAGGSLVGTEPLNDDTAISFYDHAWDIGDDAIFATDAMMSDLNRSKCGGYDGKGALPYGNDGSVPSEADVSNTTNSFNMSCTDTSTTYPIVHIEIDGQNTKIAPLKSANGKNNKGIVISTQVAFWVPQTSVQQKEDDNEVFWNSINADETLDTSGADQTEGVVSTIKPIQVGAGITGNTIDESTIDDNSVNEQIVSTPTGSGGSGGGTIKYNHYARFYKGPYQQSYIIDEDGLERVSFDTRRWDKGGLDRYISGDDTSWGWHGKGKVSRNEIVTLQTGLFAYAKGDAVEDDPVHLCTEIDNQHLEIIDMPDSFPKIKTEKTHNYHKELSRTYTSATDGIANLLIGTKTNGFGGGLIDRFERNWVEINPSDRPKYIIEVTDAPYDTNITEHELTCGNSDAGPSGWVSTTDDLSAFETGTDIDDNTKYGKITKIRVRMLEHRSWKDDSTTSEKEGIGYVLHLQARVKPSLTDDPDGSKIRIHASRGRGDLDANNVPRVDANCTTNHKNGNAFEVDTATNGWCNLPYDIAREAAGKQQLDTRAFEYVNPKREDEIYLSHSDRIYIIGAKMNIKKVNVSPNPDKLLVNDDIVDFNMTMTITGSPSEKFANVYFLDTLPDYFEYVSHTEPVDRQGTPVEGASSCSFTNKKLRCDFTKGAYSDPGVDNETYRHAPFFAKVSLKVRVKNASGNALLKNTVKGLGKLVLNGKPSKRESELTSIAFAHTAPSYNELKIRKDVPDMLGNCVNAIGKDAVTSGTLREGDCSIFAKNGIYSYALSYQNMGSADLTDMKIIDVLPFNGDGTEPSTDFMGTPAGALVADGRTPNSAFSGTSTLLSVDGLPTGATLECTTADPVTINRDPNKDTSTWTATCDAGSTAFRVSDINASIGEKASFIVSLKTEGNNQNDIYTNSFGLRSKEIFLPARSNDVSAMVDTLSLGSTVFEDKNNNGKQDSDDIGLANVTVKLYKDGVEINSTITNNSGDYLFENLVEGNYTVGVTPLVDYPLSSTGNGSDNQVDGDDNGIQSNSGEETNSSVIELLLGSESTTENAQGKDLDANTATNNNRDANGEMTIDFGFYKLGAWRGLVTEDVNHNGDLNDNADRAISGVTIRLYADTNGDGSLNQAEIDAGAVATATTDANGEYAFTDLVPGAYIAQEIQPDGYSDVTEGTEGGNDSDDNTATVANTISGTVTSGETDIANDFVEAGTGSWSGNVSEDVDKNGTADRPLAGVEIKLYIDENGDGELNATELEAGAVATASTDEHGDYNLTQLSPLSYVAVETQPAGYVDVSENEGGEDNDRTDNGVLNSIAGVISAGEEDVHNDFIERGTNALGSTVWLDVNNNGLLDDGETGIENIMIELLDANGMVIDTNTTDSEGNYFFGNLADGNYTVRIPTVPTDAPRSSTLTVTIDNSVDNDDNGIQANVGEAVTSPLITLTHDTELAEESGFGSTLDNGDYENSGDMTVDFGFFSPASLGDKVWFDANHDGKQDSNESAVPSVTVYLLDENGERVQDAVIETNASGEYLFIDLIAGTYGVEFDLDSLPTGYGATEMNMDSNESIESDANRTTGKTELVHLETGESYLYLDMGIVQVGTLRGNVSHENSEGLSPLADVTMILFDSNGKEVARTTTDDEGNYVFRNLVPADYTVREEQPEGYYDIRENEGGGEADENATTTADNEVFDHVSAGENDVANDFVEIQSASLGDRVWYDINRDNMQTEGEDGVPNVTVYLLNAEGERVAETTTDELGAYRFDNLNPLVSYSVEFGLTTLPKGYMPVIQNVGEANKDSDANPETGVTDEITLDAGEYNPTIDMGIYRDELTAGDDIIASDVKVTNLSEPVTVEVLANDNGDFNNSTVKIVLPEGFMEEHPDARLSEDGKELMVPSQGSWKVNPDGTITYIAEEDAPLVNPTPISYSVEDVHGVTYTANALVELRKTIVAGVSESNESCDCDCDTFTENNVPALSMTGLLLMILLGSLFGGLYMRRKSTI